MKKYEKTGYLHHDFKIFHLTDHEMSAYDFHYHDFHKLLFFLSGNVTYCIEGKSYQLSREIWFWFVPVKSTVRSFMIPHPTSG